MNNRDKRIIVPLLFLFIFILVSGIVTLLITFDWKWITGANEPKEFFQLIYGVNNVFESQAAPTQTSGYPQTAGQILEDFENISSDEETAPELNGSSIEVLEDETLRILAASEVPVADLIDLAVRLRGEELPLETGQEEPVGYSIGEQQSFWVTDVGDHRVRERETTLRAVTEHLYFWIENEVAFDGEALSTLARVFEERIYPTTRALFGSEANPGIDGDEHLYVVYTRGLGLSIAGYFSAVDGYDRFAHPYSNEHEIFFLNADTVVLDQEFTYGVLAHEFQHMIHWNQDRNETSWLNEGFSVLSSLVNGLDTGGFDAAYLRNPNLQLNDWPVDRQNSIGHYGASFLFANYLLNRYGNDAVQTVVLHPENGLASIDTVFAERNLIDSLTGNQIQADDFFRDWTITNLLNDPTVGDGRYAYRNLPQIIEPNFEHAITECDFENLVDNVAQYGAAYIEFDCSSNVRLRFDGEEQVGLTSANPRSGERVFWSNQGNHSDMRLTRSFDLRRVSGDISMSYWVWYDLEPDYDFIYVLLSDDGEHWEMAKTQLGTERNLTGNNYGWGYNGQSGGWVEETIDLSDFSGKEVWVRFEYVTDAAVNGAGLMLDDVSIPAIRYDADFEEDQGGWEGEGFVWIKPVLPQEFLATMVFYHQDGAVQIHPIVLDMTQSFDLEINFEEKIERAVLILSGNTRFTTQDAIYRLSAE